MSDSSTADGRMHPSSKMPHAVNNEQLCAKAYLLCVHSAFEELKRKRFQFDCQSKWTRKRTNTSSNSSVLSAWIVNALQRSARPKCMVGVMFLPFSCNCA